MRYTPEQLRELADRLRDPAISAAAAKVECLNAADVVDDIASALEAVGVEPVAHKAGEYPFDATVASMFDYERLALRLAEALRQRDELEAELRSYHRVGRSHRRSSTG